MQTEKWVKAQVKKLIDLYSKYVPIYRMCPMTFGYGESGHPDTVILINGKMLGIEVKKDKNNHHIRPELKAKPNEVMQKRQAEIIHKAGGYWICVYDENIHELDAVIREIGNVDYSGWDVKDFKQLAKLVNYYE
jgi:hypothetical protein